jgi:hypothetical protein
VSQLRRTHRLLNLIRGQTCEVWEVMNDLTRERLALLPSGEAQEREEVAFSVESQAGKADHPNVIKVYDYGTDHEAYTWRWNCSRAERHSCSTRADRGDRTLGRGFHPPRGGGWRTSFALIHRDIKPDNHG